MAKAKLPCPRNPTEGRMRTILEHHGIRARGIDMKPAEMIRRMRELGYEIEEQRRGAKKAKAVREDR